MGILVTNGMIKTFNFCEQQFDYRWNRELAPNRPSLPLKRGDWLHQLLEAHYLGEGWHKRLKKLSLTWNRLFDEEKQFYEDLPSVCKRIMESYEFCWRKEDADLKVIAAEEVFQVAWPHQHQFQGKFDLIVEDEYGRWLVEHKSHKTIPDDDYRFMDIQTARYWYALMKSGRYGKLNGILWNYIRTKPPTIPQLTKTGRVARVNRIDTDLLTFVQTLKKLEVDLDDYRDVISRLHRHNRFFRRVRVPIRKAVVEQIVKEGVLTADRIEKGKKPVRNIGRHCSWGCAYQDLCIVELYGGNAQQIIKSKYHKEDPLKYYDENIYEIA